MTNHGGQLIRITALRVSGLKEPTVLGYADDIVLPVIGKHLDTTQKKDRQIDFRNDRNVQRRVNGHKG